MPDFNPRFQMHGLPSLSKATLQVNTDMPLLENTNRKDPKAKRKLLFALI